MSQEVDELLRDLLLVKIVPGRFDLETERKHLADMWDAWAGTCFNLGLPLPSSFHPKQEQSNGTKNDR